MQSWTTLFPRSTYGVVSLLTLSLLIGNSTGAKAQGIWHHSVDGAAYRQSSATSSVIDKSSDVVVAGNVAGYPSHFEVIAYTPSGSRAWGHSEQFSEVNDTFSTLDAQGNAVILIRPDTQYDPALLVKYSRNGGARLLKVSLPTPSYPSGSSPDGVLVDASDNIFIYGNYFNSATFDYTGFVSKLSPSGNTIWTRVYPAGNYGQAEIAAGELDGQGNIVVVGQTPQADLSQRITVTKYDTQGNEVFGETLVGYKVTDSTSNAVVIDSSSNIYLAGAMEYVDLGTGGLDGALITTKLAPSGYQLWLSQENYTSAAPYQQGAEQIALDSAGNVVVGGEVSDGNGLRLNEMAKYNSGGARQWAIDSSDNLFSLLIGPGDNIYATGNFNNSDIRSTKLDSGGNFLSQRDYTGSPYNPGMTYGTAAALDASLDRLYLSGNADFDTTSSHAFERDWITIAYQQ